jgi:hypothetical protein
MRRLALALALVIVLAGCGPDLGRAGVDCGPLPQPECSQQAANARRISGAVNPGKTIWSIRMSQGGADIIYRWLTPS